MANRMLTPNEVCRRMLKSMHDAADKHGLDRGEFAALCLNSMGAALFMGPTKPHLKPEHEAERQRDEEFCAGYQWADDGGPQP